MSALLFFGILASRSHYVNWVISIGVWHARRARQTRNRLQNENYCIFAN
jgi:hypothetical protein